MHSPSINAEHRLRGSESRAPRKIHVFAQKGEKKSKESLEKLYDGLYTYVFFNKYSIIGIKSRMMR
jgi:hypothetical protein